MISITPQGDIYLCKTPLENDYKNQLTFSNLTSQLSYFNSKIEKTLDNYTYIKHDNTIKVGFPIDEIISCNYLFYKNVGFTTKYYFCFITNMEYINENCTAITFETDVWQTYQFDINYKTCFVEREHVSNDTIGLHTIPENLELGEYITQVDPHPNTTNYLDNMYYLSDILIIAAVTEYGINVAVPNNEHKYNGITGGLIYLAFKNGRDLSNYVKEVALNLSDTNIVTIFLAPANLANIPAADWITYDQTSGFTYAWEMATVPDSDYDTNMGDVRIEKPTVIADNYIPKNKKLFTFPYCFLNVTNNLGITKDYHYELFNANSCIFNIKGALGVGCSIKMYPLNYSFKGGETTTTDNKLHGIDGGKLPTCNWVNDAFTNWLTANAINLPLQVGKDFVSIVGGAVTGNVNSFLGGGFGIASTLSSVYEHSLQPMSAKGGTNQGDLMLARRNTFNTYPMSIKRESAIIIDNYFSAYGYKVNNYKIPNITGRQNWNYVKTIECNFEGDIPQIYLRRIKDIFNNGITLWHNPNTMYDYSQSNNIVS